MSISATPQPDLLRVTGLCGGHGRIPVLADIDLRVGANGFVGILGHNGMGKTTLLRTLAGHLRATGGSVIFAGQDITHWRPEQRARRGLGYVPQDRQIFPALSVRDNLRIAAVNNPAGGRDLTDRLLADFPRLQPLLDRRGGVLSGGEQQLLALARCLAAAPRLVLLDEPTGGIQPSIVEDIRERLHHYRTTGGMAFVLVEQNLAFVRALADRVLIMQKGRITRELTPQEIRQPDLVGSLAGL